MGRKSNAKDNLDQTLLVKHRPTPEEPWYSKQFNDVASTEADGLDDQQRAEAVRLLQNEAELYQQHRETQKRGEVNWLSAISKGGTMSDKQAALMLQIQESPVHSMTLLYNLLSSFNKQSRREACMIMGTMKELFVLNLLPPDRKLVSFTKRSRSALTTGLSESDRRLRLIGWAFEDELRRAYEHFVQSVEKLAHDTVEATRVAAVRCLADLLVERPEQEVYLLTSIVNKLGDSQYRVSAKVCMCLLRVVGQHPNMRRVIVEHVERLIYRPNISARAQFYAVHFLSQLTLRRGESELAVKLLDIYFGLFRLLVKKKEVDSRMLTVLLAGTNRAFPYAKGNIDQLLGEIDTLYKVVAVSRLGTALQTLNLLFQVLDASQGISDRFYCALYKRLNVAELNAGASRQTALFKLLARTLSADAVDRRVAAFVKRLLQLSLHQPAAFAAAALLLVAKISVERPTVVRLSKRQDAVVVGSSLLGDGDDEEEKFVDAPDPDVPVVKREEAELKAEPTENVVKPETESGSSSWLHRAQSGQQPRQLAYDPAARNPLFAGADCTLAYELCLLARHYHPTVRLFANHILRGEPIKYDGDALQDFTGMRFLDRFVYRNPKAADAEKRKQNEGKILSRRKTYVQPDAVKQLSVTSADYSAKPRHVIPVDEKYLHRFMARLEAERPKQKQRRPGEDSDAESVASDEFEMMLDRFEPGAANDEFEVDFTKELRKSRANEDGGQTKKGKRKRAAQDSEDESDLSLDESDLDEMDADDDGPAAADDDELSMSDFGGSDGADGDSDGDAAATDAFASAHKFESMMEAYGRQQPKWQKKLEKRDTEVGKKPKTHFAAKRRKTKQK